MPMHSIELEPRGWGLYYHGLHSRPRWARLAQATADRFWLMLASRQRLRSILGDGFSKLGRGGSVPRGT